MNFGNILNYFNVALAICFIVGAFFAARKGFFKDNAAIQEQTINALKTRVETLESQSEAGAKEIKRLRQIINTVRYALKRKGMLIEIDGDYVTLVESDGQSKSTRMQEDDTPPKVRSIKQRKSTADEDDAS